MRTNLSLRPSAMAAILAASLVLPAAPAVHADPPPWAPAHGWRQKHDPYYLGYSGRRWGDDYGVLSGRCNTSAVGAAVGGVVGGALGSQVGNGNGRTVAIVLGSVLGAVAGSRIGDEMDAADRACVGHALELAKERRQVVWLNPSSGVGYALTPVREFTVNGRHCREFSGSLREDGRVERFNGRACQTGGGVWRMI